MSVTFFGDACPGTCDHLFICVTNEYRQAMALPHPAGWRAIRHRNATQRSMETYKALPRGRYNRKAVDLREDGRKRPAPDALPADTGALSWTS